MPTRDSDTLVYSTQHGPIGTRRLDPDPPVARPRQTPRSRAGGGEPEVRIWLERKSRNGKPVSIVRGLRLDPRALADLAARLKRACGVGGTAKDGEIIIQGDHRARIAAELGNDGLRVKLAGG